MSNVYKAAPADDEAIVELLLKAFSNLYTTMGVEMSPQRAAYLSDHANRSSFAMSLIYRADDQIIGTVTLIPPSPRSKAWIQDAWDLQLLAVDPHRQGQGIARALIVEAERQAKAAGTPAICLHARRGISNQARLYLACGYRRDPAGDIDATPFREGYRKNLRSFHDEACAGAVV